ncbi:type VII secretion protein EccB [Actinoplanes sp. HUAS TT8]|uniref:type VII secretion protein EccB n=1 Tax=Actinoplanes sp. HUAS TT8 TaxID=3447453 RepID=UPI003F52473F
MGDLRNQRLIGALVAHDADPRQPALRHPGAVALTGVLIAAIAAGLLAGYGMITGAGLAEPTDPSAILLDRRSGARYVYLESDRRLHPVLNYASGVLLTGPSVKAVATGKLSTVPLGVPLGIPGAPDALPPPESLLADAWTVCTDRAGHSVLLVGTTPVGDPTGERTLLVRDPNDRIFLVRDGHRHQLPSAGGRPAVPVAGAWIDAIPAGPDIASLPTKNDMTDFLVRACVTRPADGPASIRLDPVIPSTDTVYVPRGRGAVVASPTGAVHLVTDDGRGFPLASRDLLPRLGYPEVNPVTVPAELLALLPAGPLLDPEAAGRH